MAQEPPKLLDRVRAAIRTRHYSRRTDEAYVHWIRRYIPNGAGSLRFPRPGFAATRDSGPRRAITCTSPSSSVPWPTPVARRD
jgi:hypothetical protein